MVAATVQPHGIRTSNKYGCIKFQLHMHSVLKLGWSLTKLDLCFYVYAIENIFLIKQLSLNAVTPPPPVHTYQPLSYKEVLQVCLQKINLRPFNRKFKKATSEMLPG